MVTGPAQQCILHLACSLTALACCVSRAKDSYAQIASAWRMVQVQQQYAVNLTLPLTLPAAGLAAAQAQAAAIATGTNTSALLATALAAGLISGAVHASHQSTHLALPACQWSAPLD